MIMIKEEETYESLQKYFKEQDRLIVEGQIQKPKRIIRDFTPEEMNIVNSGRTAKVFFAELDKKLGLQ